MSEAKHTPGPWVIQDQHFVVAGAWPLGLTICRVHDNPLDEISQANARLIAAAPDMLDLAKLFERSVQYEIKRSVKDGDLEGARMKTLTLNIIRAAIAKAEGKQTLTIDSEGLRAAKKIGDARVSSTVNVTIDHHQSAGHIPVLSRRRTP